MEEKYYPVFISSTKVDLKDLRLDLERMLMRTKFFPIGMENFKTRLPNDALIMPREKLC